MFYPYTEVMAQNNTIIVEIPAPTRICAGTDIRVSCISSAAGAASCTLRGWLETE